MSEKLRDRVSNEATNVAWRYRMSSEAEHIALANQNHDMLFHLLPAGRPETVGGNAEGV